MRAVAAEKKVAFVDLFSATQKLYAQAKSPLTINGVHLTAEGNRQIARVIAKELTGKEAKASDGLESIRAAVLDKNWHWFNRYRATDGNDVWGGRSGLKFTDGQTNFVVMQRELEMLDAMTANRDGAIWAAAQGKSYRVDDSNVPSPIEVKTNFSNGGQKGKLGSDVYMSGTEGLSKMKTSQGLKANLFASEEMFPELVNPVQMAVDTKGRLWAAAWETYPKWEPGKKMDDRLLILPDDNNDGVADKAITFAKVHNPTAFVFWNGGVIVCSAPDILFLKDTDGDDVADVRIPIFQGIDSADTHHTANNFFFGPDGFVYYQRGVFHKSNVETPWTKAQESGTSGMYRFNPRTYEFSFHAGNGPNPHGIGFDRWGYQYATDGTSGRAFQVRPDGNGGFKMFELLDKKVRPVPSSGVISSSHLPDEYEQNFLICNAIGFLGVKRYRLEYSGGAVKGVELEDLMVSDDGNFRPTDFEVGLRGDLYVSDWCNPIVGHMQHNIRDPMRDHTHGRIYRLSSPGRPLMDPVKVYGQPVEKLMALLEHPVDGVRYLARIELSEHGTQEVLSAAATWIKKFDPNKKEDAHNLLEALWLHQQHNTVNESLLAQVFASPEEHARHAAYRVATFWRDRSAVAKSIFDSGKRQYAFSGKGDAEEKKIKITTQHLKDWSEQNIALYKHGGEVYHREAHCGTCHQPHGKGLDPVYPPLAGSPWAQGDEQRLIKIALKGLWGDITVNGKVYPSAKTPPMTPFEAILNDHDLAAVLTYVRNSFGNSASVISPEAVKAVRESVKAKQGFYQVEEILKAHPFDK